MINLLLLCLISFQLFPEPLSDREVSIILIDYFRKDSVFLEEYHVEDIVSISVLVRGIYGEYECFENKKWILKEGYPIRIMLDYMRKESRYPCTYYCCFVFVKDNEWKSYYAPHLYFESVEKEMKKI